MNVHEDEESPLPFPEKKAWLGLLTIALVYSGFLASVANLPTDERTLIEVFVRFAIALVCQGVIMAIGLRLLAIRDPDEAKAPLDERDRAIAHRAISIAFAFLMVEVLLLALVRPALVPDWHMSVAMLLGIALADAVRNLGIIINYHHRHA